MTEACPLKAVARHATLLAIQRLFDDFERVALGTLVEALVVKL